MARKFLKQIAQFSEKMSTSKPYPVLFCVDLIERNKSLNPPREETNVSDLLPCLRPCCEYEEGWHLAETYLLISDINITNFCAYLTRVMNLIKNGNLSTTLQIFLCEQGQKLLGEIEKNSISSNLEIRESYIAMRKHFVNESQNLSQKSIDLHRCELKNGKIMWLCQKHAEATNAKILTDNLATVITNNSEILQAKFLEDVEQINIEIVDKQCNV